ncbi:hypothetical protein CQ018_11565 [Arthrobacter sp. MYb227]|nr:hypothetical protein CQ018_11565 [Arthrobacter sp. MYb227]
MGTRNESEVSLRQRLAQYPSVELVELNCTDFTVSVLKAHDLSVYVPAAEYGEYLLLLAEGTATISQIDFELKLSEDSNQLFFVGKGHGRGGTLLMSHAVLVLCKFPDGLGTTLARWGLPLYQITNLQLSISLLNNTAGRFLAELVANHASTNATAPSPIAEVAKSLLKAVLRANLLELPENKAFTTNQRALELVLERGLDPELTVTAIAELLHVSVRQLQRAFVLDLPLSLVLMRHRAVHAQKLLTQPQTATMSLTWIAQKSGFSNSRTLRRATLQIFGQCPQQIRTEWLDARNEES